MKLKLLAPESLTKQIWDVVIFSLTIFLAIEIPLRLALDIGWGYVGLEVMISVFLFIDIVVNFNSQTYIKGILIKDRKEIRTHYVCRGFIFDLLAAVPFVLIALVLPQLYWLKWLSLTRLFKLVRLNSLISQWRNRQVFNPSVLRLGFFFFWILLIAHWIATIWIYIARVENLEDIPSYIDAIYWCITTITTVGYGDISPVTDLQKVLTMVAMILGVGVYGYVIGNVASLLSNIDLAKAGFLKQLEDINAYLSYKSVPRKLKQKVQDYYQYIWHNRLARSEQGLLLNLPDSLKSEISLHVHRQLIEQVPFFKDTNKAFMIEIISQLQPIVYLPGDTIFKKGDVGNCMYFISDGSVNILSEDEITVLATIHEGDYFGEIALISKVERTKSAIANEYCILYMLEKIKFDALLAKYPKFKKHVFETFNRRYKKPKDEHIKTENYNKN